jgi:hypothetical protein
MDLINVAISEKTTTAPVEVYESFLTQFEAFVQQATTKTHIFEKKINELKGDINAVGESYGENKEYKTKDFINNLINFAQNVRTASQ